MYWKILVPCRRKTTLSSRCGGTSCTQRRRTEPPRAAHRSICNSTRTSVCPRTETTIRLLISKKVQFYIYFIIRNHIQTSYATCVPKTVVISYLFYCRKKQFKGPNSKNVYSAIVSISLSQPVIPLYFVQVHVRVETGISFYISILLLFSKKK